MISTRACFIPKGSTVFANIYGITRDPEIFPEPEEFKPERFLDNEDPLFENYNLTFGFGRRICPGQHVAVDLLFLLATRILWAFDIVGKNPEVPHLKAGPPKPFSYTLVPRSSAVTSVVMEEFIQAVDEAKQLELETV